MLSRCINKTKIKHDALLSNGKKDENIFALSRHCGTKLRAVHTAERSETKHDCIPNHANTYTTSVLMIALKCAIRYFHNLLTALRTVSNAYAQVAGPPWSANPCNTLSAYHVQHIVRHVARRDNSAIKFDRV